MAHCRVVQDLKWARGLEKRPSCIPQARKVRGLKALGLSYERAFGSAVDRTLGVVTKVCTGKWFEFQDRNGLGYCQPDVIVEFKDFIVVCECKLTETDQGRDQIRFLYRPVLQKFFERPVRGIVVARHLTRESDRGSVVNSMEEAIKVSSGFIPTLHWIGKGRV